MRPPTLVMLAACATPALDETIHRDALLGHLEAFQAIADANDGNRSAFTPGYAASADYVADALEAAGYDVTLQPVTVSWPTVHDAALSEVAPNARDFERDAPDGEGWSVWRGGPGVDVTATVYPIDLVLPPGPSANTSTSGCEIGDYDGFEVGAIALVQRGTCTFRTKAEVATEAGAAAMLLFNEGQEGRTVRLDGATIGAGEPGVAFFSLSYSLGAELGAAAEAGVLQMRAYADVTFDDVTDHNVLADTPDGDPERTVLVGAHLDSVLAGPGINDNGSGSAVVLELALQLAERRRERPLNRVRFAFWAAEELGLVGSRQYATELGTTEWAVFNYDMVASPNGFPMVYDADGTFDSYDPPPGTAAMELAIGEWFDDQGLPWFQLPGVTASDSFWWIAAGAPVGGIYTGSSEPLWDEAHAVFGGLAGEPLDPCYHQACDTLDQVNVELLEHSGRAAAHGLEVVANATDLTW